MAHFIRVIKAISLKSKWKEYLEEKIIALNENESDFESPKKKYSQRRWLSGLIDKINTPNTPENLVWTSFLGFTGGVIITYIFFLFFYIGVSFSLGTTTFICGFVGIFLCLGLVISSTFRCFILLLLPVFFSKEGRHTLLAYALFLAFTGPAKNTMHNIKILSNCMICGQELVKRTLKQIVDIVKAPFGVVKQTLQKVTKTLKKVVESMKVFIMKIKRIIVSILKVIEKATSWLGNIVNFCQKKVGTPFQRCLKTFDDAIADCTAKLSMLYFLCHVVNFAKAFCYTVKGLDFICLFTDLVSDKVIGAVEKKLREFSQHANNLLYVSIEFSHSYEYETTAFNSTKEIPKTILQKISQKVEKLQDIFSLCGFFFSFMFFVFFFKVYYYRYKFLSSDRYDNIYINKYIIDLDIQRSEMNRETVLPLERRERKKYAKPTSLRILKDEKSRISQSMFLLNLTSFKIISFLAADYCLFWILMVIYEVGRDVQEEVGKSRLRIHTEERGFLENFYRDLGNAFQVPENPNTRLTPLHCLPDPIQPDTKRYIQIGFLVGLCWVLTLTKPYGLRLRNVVMCHYYPDRARERAIWLYNHILQSRSTFLRFTRRQLRRKVTTRSDQQFENMTLNQRIIITGEKALYVALSTPLTLLCSFSLLGALFGKSAANTCLLCEAFDTEAEPLKRCKTPDCQGNYCIYCFDSLENVCTICRHPVEYGDISDISEEIDSSEEDFCEGSQSYSEDFDSEEYDENQEFLTFKEMESRDRFWDVEANKVPDYAKLGDLYNDEEALRRRLKEVLYSHLQAIENGTILNSQFKLLQYEQIKSKIENIILNLEKKKWKQLKNKKSQLRLKFLEKINNLKRFQVNKRAECEKLLRGETKSTNKVTFKLGEDQKPITNYDTLKCEIKAKIQSPKEKILKSEMVEMTLYKTPSCSEASSSSTKSEAKAENESSSEDSDSETSSKQSYYLVEEEKGYGICVTEPPFFDEKSESNVSFSRQKSLDKIESKDYIA